MTRVGCLAQRRGGLALKGGPSKGLDLMRTTATSLQAAEFKTLRIHTASSTADSMVSLTRSREAERQTKSDEGRGLDLALSVSREIDAMNELVLLRSDYGATS